MAEKITENVEVKINGNDIQFSVICAKRPRPSTAISAVLEKYGMKVKSSPQVPETDVDNVLILDAYDAREGISEILPQKYLFEMAAKEIEVLLK